MGRFSVIVDDKLDEQFRIKAVKRRIRLNKAFEEAMRLWLKSDRDEKG